jgi:hypothetical protein
MSARLPTKADIARSARQFVTVGIRTFCPFAPVSRLPPASQRPRQGLAIDGHTDQGLLIIFAATVERFVERRAG